MERRLRIFKILLLVAFGVLFARLFYLQIIRGNVYKERAEENRTRSVPIEAPRGVVFDRNGKPLVRNQVSFDVAVIPEEIAGNLEVLNKLISILKLDRKKIFGNVFGKEHQPEYVFLKQHLSFREFASLSEMLPLPGVYVFLSPMRQYLHPLRDAHLLGYVGEISESELKQRLSGNPGAGSLIGRDGIEKQYDRILRGKNGAEELEVDSTGKLVKVLNEVQPEAGHDLYLTIDDALQEVAWKSLEEEAKQLQTRNGVRTPVSVVALDPNNGGILAYVSWPSFNPNWFVRGMSQRQYSSILRAGFDPLLNRPIEAAYPCGSTFKLITGSAALQEKIVSAKNRLFCPGYYHIPGLTFHCFVRSGHGAVKFTEAVAESCDVYFYQLGDRLGISRLDQYAALFGMGARTGIDLPEESPGLLPTPKWKRSVYHERWYPADTINLAIGQGYLEATPMQLALAVEMVANGGTAWRPHFFEKAGDEPGISAEIPRYPERDRTLPIDSAVLALVRTGMKGAVDHGTATAAKLAYVGVAGKTGTAENLPTPLNPRGRNHAWFVSFAPFEKPQLVVVVMMEQSGGYGGEYAAPIAKKIYAAYFKDKIAVNK